MKFPWLVFALILIFWSLSLYFYHHPVLFSSLVWLKIAVLLSIILILELFYLIIAIAQISLKKFKFPLIISAILGLIIISLLFIIKDYLAGLPPQTTIFFLLLFIYGGLGFAILFERSLKSSRMARLEAVYLLTSFGVFITIITILYLFLPLIIGLREYLWLGPIFAFLFLLSSIIGYYLIKGVEKRKEAERLVEEWEKLAQAKDQFLLSLQHHLRTPLTPLKGYLERILEGTYGREENPVIKEKLIEMKKLVNTLYSLVESLLDIQELRLGKKILNLEDCQINNLIEGVIEELKPQAEQKGLYLEFERGLLPTIKLDKKRMREAIWNLVDNAIKYTNRGGVTIKSQTGNDKLQTIISDTGIGMEKEEIEHFLQGKLFERGERAKKLYGPGRGMGLSIAREFIKAHGGKIWAESKGWGQGTTFWIELPIQ